MKAQRSKSSIQTHKNKRPTSPEEPRKSLPKQIKRDSHILTPTTSSTLKIISQKTTLSKSKSTTNLIAKSREKQKNHKVPDKIVIVKHTACEKLHEFDNIFIDFDEVLNGNIVKKTSNPKNLEIDTDIIENEYCSPISYNPLPIEVIKLDTLNFYSSAFTMKEAISSDLLTGKIYQSRKSIENFMLTPQPPLFSTTKHTRRHKNTNSSLHNIDSILIEISYPDEFSHNRNDWKKIANNFTNKTHITLKKLLKSLTSQQKSKKKNKIDKSKFIRNPRCLKDLSLKIGQIIESVLLKNDNSFQNLIENTSESSKLPLNFPPQYFQSQDFFVDLFFCLWEYKQKPLSSHSLSVYLESDRMISEIPKLKDPSLRLQHLLKFIPLLLITWRHTEAAEYIQSSFKIVPNSRPALLWQTWLEIFTKKATSATYYALAEGPVPPNLSTQYKIGLAYSYFFSCLFGSTSRTVTYVKTLDLGDWENLIIADIYLRSSDKNLEELGTRILVQLAENNNTHIKFLAIFRLFRIFKEYNQYSKALEVMQKAQKIIFPDNFRVIIEVCTLKALSYVNLEITTASEVPLLKYQYARLSLKYNLKSPMDKVCKCINQTCAFSQLYSLSTFQFPVNFWKFIMLRKLGIHRLAAKQAILSLDYECSDSIKHTAITEYTKSIENAGTAMQLIAAALVKKQIPAIARLYGPIDMFDETLGACMRSIYSKTIEDKCKIPQNKFEGYFAVWTCLYRSSKQKEKQFKPLEGQEEIDKRDSNHPLHILSVRGM